VWRSEDGTTWQQVNRDGFGDADNEFVWVMVEFGDLLYVGVGNEEVGAGVWRGELPIYIPLIVKE